MSEQRWALLIRPTSKGNRYAASIAGKRVTGWHIDFWRLYWKMTTMRKIATK